LLFKHPFTLLESLMTDTSSKNETPSAFYFACRNGDIETVQHLLTEFSLEKLDRMEPNGSTALHAACFYKHIDIIKLLLERGFSRRVTNKYNNTPFDESDTETIRELFLRSQTSNRFGGDVSHEREKLTWVQIDGNEQNISHKCVSDTYDGNRLEYGTFQGEKILQQLGDKMPKIDVIRRLFHRAMEEKDCTRLIQAYTAETDFYNRVNDYLISRHADIRTSESGIDTNPMSQFTDTIHFNHQLHEQHPYIGKCYRSFKISSDNDLNIYKVGTKLINRTFISTTKDRQLAESYVRNRASDKKYAVIFTFEIRYNTTALDIENLSEYSYEKEILIMNNSLFKVIEVSVKNNFDVEIALRESKSAQGGLFGWRHVK
jgi:hypothetical protein